MYALGCASCASASPATDSCGNPVPSSQGAAGPSDADRGKYILAGIVGAVVYALASAPARHT